MPILPIVKDVHLIPSSILAAFPEQTKAEMGEQAIRLKDYQNLNAVLQVMANPAWLLNEAIELLDEQAIDLIVAAQKPIGDAYVQQYLIELFEKLEPSEALNLKLNPAEIRAKIGSIFKKVIELKDASLLTSEDLETLARFATNAEYNKFITSRAIDPEVLACTDVYHYVLATKTPLLELADRTHASTVDILLSRSYSTAISAEKVQAAYENLLQMHPMAREMLQFLALTISKGDDLRINFVPNGSSRYSPFNNLIEITLDTDYLGADIIHEVGHCFYDKLLNNGAQPIKAPDLSAIQDIIAPFEATYAADPYGFALE